MFLRSFIFITLLLSFSNSIAQTLLEPGDNEYWVYEKWISVHPHSRPFGYLSPLTQFAEEMRPYYNTHFNWQLDEMATITLASSKNQITNALAMSVHILKPFYTQVGFHRLIILRKPIGYLTPSTTSTLTFIKPTSNMAFHVYKEIFGKY